MSKRSSLRTVRYFGGTGFAVPPRVRFGSAADRAISARRSRRSANPRRTIQPEMSSTETDPSLPVLQLSLFNEAVPVGKSSSREATEATASESVPNPLERQGTISSDLSELQRTRLEIFEADKDLQDLCRDNGLTALQFAKKAPTVAMLITFLGFWPNMKSVMHFSALRELSIVKHPTISRIEGLESCPNLEQLTITECGITQIENLEACRKLKKLNLSSNNIQSMEPVSRLDALEELWLCDNSIERLEGLWRATKLTTLWMCRNRIERIDSALNACVNLVELNLSDNRIFSFKSLLSLANLDQLSVLTLSDPHYGENPVCRLCNYQTYVMCQLTRLSWLDTIELSSRTKQIAEATMLKKKMYYNMRIKCMKRDAHHRIRRANDVRRNHEQHIEMNISALARHKKDIEQALMDLACEEMGKMENEEAQSMRDKLRAIDEYLTEKCGAMARMNQDFDRVQTRLEWAADVNISRLLLELDTGGNIRLEDGSPSDAWYASCVDLIKSRLFAADLRPFGVSDVRITRVTRINNRYLRNRFHARMEEILVVNENQVKENVSKKGVTVSAKDSDEEGVGNVEDTIESVASPGSVPENSLEYLFYSQPPMMEYMHKPEPDQFHAAEYGFRDPGEYQAMGLDGAVKLSNSIALLETSRLLASFASKNASLQKHELSGQSAMKYSTLSVRQQETELRTGFTREMRDAAKLASQGVWDVPGGTLLVVKVFPGYTKTILDSEAVPSPIDRRDHVGIHSLQVMKSSHLQNTNVTTEAPQKMYYVFDKTLVLPEYLVEYQYITATQLATAMEAVLSPESELKSACAEPSGLGAAVAMADDYERRYRIRRPPSPQGTEDTVPSTVNILDDAVLKLLETGHRAGFASSSEAMLPMTRVNLVETGRLKQLHLIGCGMEIMPDLSVIGEVLEVLVLAYNRIPQLDASLHVLTKLTRLDVSSNRLLRIEYIDSLTSLVDLDASYNQIQTFDDLIRFPPACKPPLRRVNLRKNPICSTKRYRLRMLRAAGSSLEVLDEQGVCRDEFLASQRLLTKLSAEVLWARYQLTKDSVTPRNVRGNEHGSRGGKLDEQHCWTSVEELMLARELISCIEGLEPFVNLRIMSLADNAVRHIGGLHKCTRLEELNLEDNELTKVENLSSLSSLKRLNIARNRLTSIDHLETLENLTQLSLEDNQITSLRGLASAMKLMELYVGNNRIESLKEIQHLKALPKLTILDLSGNEIARLPDYRLYTVYYLRRVKVLDGVSVSPQDQSEAKHKYSGKLTLEFIAEKCGGSNFERLQELDLSSCRIRELGTIHGKSFPNLRDLNLENNQISDILGLDALPKLRILNLNRNRIERLLLSPNAAAVPEAADSKGVLGCTKVEQLFLAYNQISDMTALGFQHLDSLRVLHLQGNAIVFFAGLVANTELLELRLDKNKIRQLDPHSTQSLRRLRVLSLDDNGLRTLSNFNELMSIEFLDLSNNRLAELEELDKLTSMPTIVELRLLNNPLVKKHMYRHTALFKLNTLRTLDGREVTAEERERVEVLFLHERTAALLLNQTVTDRPCPSIIPTTQFSLPPSSVPGIKHGVMQTSSTSTHMVVTPGNRNVTSQLNWNDAISGPFLRKTILPAGFSPNQQHPVQSVSTFPKSDQPPDTTIVIAPSNTTTKSLLNGSTSVRSTHRAYSLSNQAGVGSTSSTMSLNSPSATVTVASALNASLSSSGADQLSLGTLRFDRRRMHSVHYDPAFQSTNPQAGPVGMATGASSLAGSVITSNSILRAPINVTSSQSATIHPLSADMTLSSKSTPSTFSSGVATEPTTRSFSGYIVSVGNQKQYGSIHDRMSAADLSSSLAKSSIPTRPR